MPNRRDLLKVAPFFAAVAAAQGAKLPNATMSAAQAKLIKEPFGDHHVYFEGPTDQLKSMTAGSLRLNAGATPHPPHDHSEEEFMVITEGTGEIVLDGKTTKVAPGAIMYSAAGKTHGILNTGKTPLTFYYFKWTK